MVAHRLLHEGLCLTCEAVVVVPHWGAAVGGPVGAVVRRAGAVLRAGSTGRASQVRRWGIAKCLCKQK